MATVQKIQGVLGVVGAVFAAAISVTFAVLYGIQYNKLVNSGTTCVAWMDVNKTAVSQDVTANFLFVLKFGMGVYIAQSCILVIAFPSGFNPIVGLINALF